MYSILATTPQTVNWRPKPSASPDPRATDARAAATANRSRARNNMSSAPRVELATPLDADARAMDLKTRGFKIQKRRRSMEEGELRCGDDVDDDDEDERENQFTPPGARGACTPSASSYGSWGRGRVAKKTTPETSERDDAVTRDGAPTPSMTKSSENVVACEHVEGGIESGTGGNGNPHADAKALKKFADGLWRARKEKNDPATKLRMMKTYAESVINFVEAAARTSDQAKKKTNYRGDVDFALFVEKVCSTCYTTEMGRNPDFSFRCMALRALILRLSVACSVRVMKLNTYAAADAIKDADDGAVIAELTNYQNDTRAMTESMSRVSSHLRTLKTMVPENRVDAARVCEHLLDFASDGGLGTESTLRIVDDAHELLAKIFSMKNLED